MIFKNILLLLCFLTNLMLSQVSLTTSYLGRWGFGGSSPMFQKDNYGFFFSSGKMCLYDISDLKNIRRVSEIDAPISNPLMYDSLIIGVKSGGVVIINVQNPASPIISSISVSVPVQDYFVKNNLLFLAAQNDGLIIYDISNQKNPVLKSTFTTSDLAFDVTVYKQYAFVGNLYTGIQIINCSNLDSLQVVSHIPISPVTRMRAIENKLFISFLDSLVVYDVTSPQNPVVLSRFYVGSIKDFQWFGSKIYTITSSVCQIYDYPKGASLIKAGYFESIDIASLRVSSKLISLSGNNGCTLWDTTNIYQPNYLYSFSRSFNTNALDIKNNIIIIADGYFMQTIDKKTLTQCGIYFNDDPEAYAYDVIVKDTLAYTASASAGLVIYNIANPNNIVKMSSFNTPGSARSIFVIGNTCYVADFGSGLRIIDVSNPSQPFEQGFYDTPGTARGVYVVNDKAYIADGTSGLQIIDVSHGSNPMLLGSYNTPGSAYNVVVSEGYAFVADYSGGIRMIDVHNSTMPSEKTFWSTNVFVNSVALSGSRLFAAVTDSGVQIFDISDSLKRIGFSKIYRADNVRVLNDTIYATSLFQGGIWMLRENTLTSVNQIDYTLSNFHLDQNYPNPFNPETTIEYFLPFDGRVALKIYDVLGREVKTVFDEFKSSGRYTTLVNADNMSSGVYYYKIHSGKLSDTKKMIILK